MEISIADRTCDASELARFFHKSLTQDYIARPELQGYRAMAPGKWSPNIRSILESEIKERLEAPRTAFPQLMDWHGIVIGREKGSLVALSFVSTCFASSVPHATIEDIVVDPDDRGQGRGRSMMKWLMSRAEAAGVRRFFLESGEGNHRAHKLFADLGYRTSFAPETTSLSANKRR
jgi:ribosomal protein S18 acetylase RimI-like enzyme